MHASLVKLVDDDRPEIGKQRVMLEAGAQHAFGCDEEAGGAGEAAFEAHLPADLPADRPSALVGNSVRDGPRGHAPWLQEDERPSVKKGRRNPRGFPCTRLRRDDECPRLPQIGHNPRKERVDRKGVSHSQ